MSILMILDNAYYYMHMIQITCGPPEKLSHLVKLAYTIIVISTIFRPFIRAIILSISNVALTKA